MLASTPHKQAYEQLNKQKTFKNDTKNEWEKSQKSCNVKKIPSTDVYL